MRQHVLGTPTTHYDQLAPEWMYLIVRINAAPLYMKGITKTCLPLVQQL